MVKPKVLVTRRWPQAVEAVLAERYDAVFNGADKPMTTAELQDALRGADAVLPTVTDKIGPEVFESVRPQAKILANFGVGFSHIDTDAAKALGIRVTNTPDVLSECTADLAITLLLMAARRAREGEHEVRNGAWTGWRPTHLLGSKVSGKTLGIIGFGRIGQAVAQRAHHGFGMQILVYNRSQVSSEVLGRFGARQTESVDALLQDSDFVSLHFPGGGENRHLIDARRLGLMKPSAYLINTARGEVIDEEALVSALHSGSIAGAGLDVYDGEPNVNSGLLGCRNAILLPHLGSATMETREAMGFRVLDNLEDFFAGRRPRDLVV